MRHRILFLPVKKQSGGIRQNSKISLYQVTFLIQGIDIFITLYQYLAHWAKEPIEYNSTKQLNKLPAIY